MTDPQDPPECVAEFAATFVRDYGPDGLNDALTGYAQELSIVHDAPTGDVCPRCKKTSPCVEATWAWARLLDRTETAA